MLFIDRAIHPMAAGGLVGSLFLQSARRHIYASLLVEDIIRFNSGNLLRMGAEVIRRAEIRRKGRITAVVSVDDDLE